MSEGEFMLAILKAPQKTLKALNKVKYLWMIFQLAISKRNLQILNVKRKRTPN